MSKIITIDNVEYQLDELSDLAKSNIGMLRAVEGEIQRLNVQLAVAKTAQIAYAKAVQENLPNKQ